MYHVDILNKGAYTFDVQAGKYKFVVDLKGNGVTPPDALLASLGTCIGVYVRKYAEGMKLDLPEFSISAEADLSKEPPLCFRKINVLIDFKDAALDEKRIQAMLQFIENCPVHNTLKANPDVDVKIK